MKIHRCVSAIAIALCLAGGAQSQTQTTVSSREGDEGSQLGKSLLRSAPGVSHNPQGGERGAGTITIDGVGTIGVNEIAPGADRAGVDRISAQASGLDATNAEAAGAAALRERLRDNTASGQAFRSAIESDEASTAELTGGDSSFWDTTVKAAAAAQRGSFSGVFSDCRDEVVTRQGERLVIEETHEYTCEQNVDNSPQCGRYRVVEFAELGRDAEEIVILDSTITVSNRGGSFPIGVDGELERRMRYRDSSFNVELAGGLPAGVSASSVAPGASNGFRGSLEFSRSPDVPCPAGPGVQPGAMCPPAEETADVRVVATVTLAAGDWYRERIEERPGRCTERYATEFGCQVRFRCASAVAEIDGQSIDAATAARIGMSALYNANDSIDGAADVAACAVAEAVPFCTVCADDENNANCVTPDPRSAIGQTCSALQGDQRCREKGERQCVLYDEADPRRCVTWARTFTCTDRRYGEPETITTVRNSCDIPDLQCAGDGCRRQEDLKGDDPGMSLQEGMAGLAVAHAMTTDVTTASSAGAGAGQGVAPSAPEKTEGNALGYDRDDNQEYEATSGGLTSTLPPGAAPSIDASQIQVFRGRGYSCKRALGGLIRCCQPTKSDANQRYWNLFGNINKGVIASHLLNQGGPTQGSWAALASGGGSLNAISQSLTSTTENVTGGGTGGAGPGDGSIADVHDRFMAEARTQIKPNLSPGWACSRSEFDLAVQREIGNCSFAGNFCARRVFGVCLERREAYCCYGSPMSKMLRAHADGGTIQHGNPRSPNCSGLSLERFASIDWDTLDLQPLVSHMAQGQAFPSASEQGSSSMQRFSGEGVTAGGSGRQSVDVRTEQRLSAIDADRVFEDVREEASGLVEDDARGEDSEAVLSFGTTYHIGRAGEAVRLRVARSGRLGTASFGVSPALGAGLIDGIEGASQSWAAGDVTDRFIIVRLSPAAQVGAEIRLSLQTSNTVGAVSTAIIEVVE